MILFIIVYMLALCCYLYTRNAENKRMRSRNKYLMATMYLVCASYWFFRKYTFASYHPLLIAALIFAWLGDVFLVFDFGRGGDFFLAGHVCFVLYEQIVMVDHGKTFGDFAWTFIVVALMLAVFIFLCGKYPERFKLGKMRWPMTFYLSSIFMHGITGLAMALLLPGTSYVMMGIGSLLFMISDMILTTYKFVLEQKKWLVRANSLTYFTGLLLIVLAMSLV